MGGIDVGRRDLPGGEVCFLFTDVESSTAILREVGDAEWGRLQHEMHAIVRYAVESVGGTLVNTEGDGCFAAFPSAAAGTEAAAAAQRVLGRVRFGLDRQLRVRMGLHIGVDIQPRDDDYVALAVHQAARVAAAAGGGQVLVTRPVVERCADQARFADLGLFSVRDFDGAVRLFELLQPGRSPTRPRLPLAFDHRVPSYRTALVGRDAEINDVRQRMQNAPLVTLTGPVGIGKTRLAIAVLSQLSDAAAVGPWLVDLTGAEEASDVWDLVSRAVGRPGDAKLAVHLDAVLAGRPATLVLDGCEHVTGASATAAQLLLDWNPTLRVLATSLTPLALPGEVVYEIPALAVPLTAEPASVVDSPAGRLFLERLRRAGVDGVLTAEAARAVHAVCAGTGGVPLALELLAGLCGGFAADAPESWPTDAAGPLEPLVTRCVDALPSLQARGLAALALPPQPVAPPLAAAAVRAVGAADPDGLVDHLGRRGLLDVDDAGCWLSGTVRERAVGAVSAGDRQAVLDALLAECLSITAEDPVPLSRHEPAAGSAIWLMNQDTLPVGDRQRLAAQLATWWAGRLGTRRAREHLTAALALGRAGRATAAVHLAIADTYSPGEETVDTERHVREAARLLGEHDAVDPSLVARMQAAARRAATHPQPGD
ncbi:MAG: hypothetical protein QOC66_4279 [Pseudonocardiales bacterium]|nr:hypothetical protein [Pseudonocardiales bacterium]